jgi:hypothetical protein
MKTVALLAVVPSLAAQMVLPSPRELLDLPRPLTNTEIAAVLGASQEALAGKTFRLSATAGGNGTEVLMDPAGQPRMIRMAYGLEDGTVGGVVPGSSNPPAVSRWREDVVTIVDDTRRPARRCDGSAGDGEMVIEFERRGPDGAWTATARRRDSRDAAGRGIAPVLAMWSRCSRCAGRSPGTADRSTR